MPISKAFGERQLTDRHVGNVEYYMGKWTGVLRDNGHLVTETDPLDSEDDVWAALQVLAEEREAR